MASQTNYNVTTKEFFHLGEWSKPKIGGVTFLTAIGALAIATAVALIVLKHYGISLGPLPINAMSDHTVFVIAGGLGGASLAAFAIDGVLIHRTRKAANEAKPRLKEIFQGRVTDTQMAFANGNKYLINQPDFGYGDKGERMVALSVNSNLVEHHYFSAKEASKEGKITTFLNQRNIKLLIS